MYLLLVMVTRSRPARGLGLIASYAMDRLIYCQVLKIYVHRTGDAEQEICALMRHMAANMATY